MVFTPTDKSLSDPRPDITVEGRYGQGAGGSGVSARDILIIGDGDGYATTAIVYPLQSEADAISLYGTGSPIHRAFRAITQASKGLKISAISGTVSDGDAAAQTLTVAGTAVTSGVIKVWIAGQLISVAFAKDDLHTAISDDLQDAINAVYFLPVTAADVTGTVTVTARYAGTYGNSIRIRCEVTGGSGITCTAGAATLADGTNSGDLTDALSAIENTKYYCQVNLYNDATNIALHKAQLEDLSSPSVGIDQVGITALTDSIATANSQAQTTNSALYQVACYYNAESTFEEFASWVAAGRMRQENSYFGFNLNNYQLPVQAKGPALASDEPSGTNVVSALNSGVTPLKTSNGRVEMVRSITTKSLIGSTPDYRVRETNIVSVTHAVAERLNSIIVSEFNGKKVMDDTPEPQSDRIRQPKHLRAAIIRVIDEFTVGLYKDNLDTSMVDDMVESIAVEKDTGMLSGQFDIYVMQNLLRVWLIASESSPAY